MSVNSLPSEKGKKSLTSFASTLPSIHQIASRLREYEPGDPIAIFSDGKWQEFEVQRGHTEPLGSVDSVAITVGFGPGRYNREVSAAAIRDGFVDIEATARHLSAPARSLRERQEHNAGLAGAGADAMHRAAVQVVAHIKQGEPSADLVFDAKHAQRIESFVELANTYVRGRLPVELQSDLFPRLGLRAQLSGAGESVRVAWDGVLSQLDTADLKRYIVNRAGRALRTLVDFDPTNQELTIKEKPDLSTDHFRLNLLNVRDGLSELARRPGPSIPSLPLTGPENARDVYFNITKSGVSL